MEAADSGGTGDAPAWLVAAYAVIPEVDRVVVDGAAVQRAVWGDPGRPGVVLVHGGAANISWWDHIAPLLADYRVVAMDLSGHGDSDRRDDYHVDLWVDEVLAVTEGVGLGGPPVVVGHSMGGFISTAVAVRAGHDLAGVVVLDSPMVKEDAEVEAARLGKAFGAPRVYPDAATAIERYRTVPRQATYDPHIRDHVARASLGPVDGGYTWKFDPRLFLAVSRSAAAEMLPEVRCRFALLRAQHGLVTAEVGQVMYDRLGRVAPVVEIPLAGHHMMLDQPLLLVTALRTLLADWEHSVPFTR